MSYEGYREILCENGHYAQCGAYDNDDELPCVICGKPTAWTNEIDCTNGYVDATELEVSADEVTERCKECGEVRIVTAARFKIPHKKDDPPSGAGEGRG